jgi:hypothetical protein
MATEQELVGALAKADAQGDHEGAQQIADMIKAQRAGTVPANDPAPAPAPQSSHDAAAAAGLQAGADSSPLMAGISQAAQQGTFGGQNYINAGVRWAAQRALGVKSPDSFADNLEYSRSKSAGEAAAHPIASTIGGAVGGLLGGGAVGDAVKVAGKVVPGVARAAAVLTPKAGEAVANVARSAGINGLIGGGTSLAQGDDALTAARDAGISAVAGPVVGKVASKAFNLATPVAQRAYSTLAKSLDESPAVLAAASQAYTRLTGQQAPLAALTGLKSQGKLKALAAANEDIGTMAAQAADQGGAPLHQQLADVAAARTNPQSALGMLAVRDRNMTDVMSQPAPTTGNLSLADAPVKLKNQRAVDVMNDPLIARALNPDGRVNGSMFSMGDLHNAINTDTLTVGDLDHIRLQLRNQQSANSSAMAGISRNPEVAKAYGAAAQAVEGLASSAHPAYGTAMNQYKQVSRYANSFQHGLDGKAMLDTDNADLARDLAHPSGVGAAGYAHGQILNKAQQALDAIAPGTVKPQADMTGGDAVHIAHAVAAPSALSVAGIMNHLSGTALPKQAQGIVADMLYSKDPVRVQQAIANLDRARVSSDDMRRLAGVIGGVAAQKINDHLSNRDN